MPGAERLRESELNALLRRVDGRFLIRQPRRPTSVCRAPVALTRAVGLVSDPVPSSGSNPTRADLAVLVNPTRRSLQRAWDDLRPGGELYAEWYLPPASPARLCERLVAAGFADVRCYWTWPRPGRAPRFWLPLDDPKPTEFFLRSRPGSGRRRLRRVLRAAWRCLGRLGLLVPVCVVACKPPRKREEDVEALMRERWEEWGFGRPPERFSWLLLTGGRRSVNKVVGLPFADSDRRPRMVVKFARSEPEERQLRREGDALQRVRATRPELGGVPGMLFLGRRCGRLCLGETAFEGMPLILRLNSETFSVLAHRVTQWLVDLAGHGDSRYRASWSDRLLEEPLQFFEETFADVVSTRDLARTRELLESLGDLPLVFEHRDCSPWNILVEDGGRLGVVDWESSEGAGLPALDLVYFLTYTALVLEDAFALPRARDAYARMRDASTRTGAIVADCERAYVERLGLALDVLVPLRLLCWIVHSRSEYRRLEQDVAGSPSSEALFGSLFLALWQEELRRAP